MAFAPLPPSSLLSRRTTVQPIGSERWRAAAFRWAYAALFCLVTDAWKTKTMTSPARVANGRSSRGEAFLPFRFALLTRVSERARARGVGELSSRVARMSGEAPPPGLYIKGWRRGSAAPFRAGAEQSLERPGGFCQPAQSLRDAGGRHCNPRPSIWKWPSSRPMVGPSGQYRPYRSPRSSHFSGPAQLSESVHPLYSALKRISKMEAAAP